jgi:hypothetical protein
MQPQLLDFCKHDAKALNYVTHLLDCEERATVQHPMTVRTDDGEVDQPSGGNPSQFCQRRSVMTFCEPVAERPVGSGEVERTDFAQQMTGG